MNLRQIANNATRIINPNITATLKRSNGYTTDEAGKRTPTFEVLSGEIQVQAMSTSDLQHADNLNIQGVLRSVFMNGNWAGVVRTDEKGGDVLRFPQYPNGEDCDWLVVHVIEAWPDWTRVIVCLQ